MRIQVTTDQGRKFFAEAENLATTPWKTWQFRAFGPRYKPSTGEILDEGTDKVIGRFTWKLA